MLCVQVLYYCSMIATITIYKYVLLKMVEDSNTNDQRVGQIIVPNFGLPAYVVKRKSCLVN